MDPARVRGRRRRRSPRSPRSSPLFPAVDARPNGRGTDAPPEPAGRGSRSSRGSPGARRIHPPRPPASAAPQRAAAVEARYVGRRRPQPRPRARSRRRRRLRCGARPRQGSGCVGHGSRESLTREPGPVVSAVGCRSGGADRAAASAPATGEPGERRSARSRTRRSASGISTGQASVHAPHSDDAPGRSRPSSPALQQRRQDLAHRPRVHRVVRVAADPPVHRAHVEARAAADAREHVLVRRADQCSAGCGRGRRRGAARDRRSRRRGAGR